MVDVWRADLTAASDGLGELLCAEEHERARRLPSERDRRLWIRSRGVLRALLARYLGSDPRALRFAVGAHGKPMLERLGSNPTGVSLCFNLSHSGELALYAVSAKRSVGIDVEVARGRKIDELAIAARVLGPAQARRLAGLAKGARTREFMRAWVANEAAVKCRGAGLGFARPSQGPPTTELWTVELDVGPRAAAAVTVEGGRCELRCWEWRG
jgi:4'-phosphopantetheinyl transferase